MTPNDLAADLPPARDDEPESLRQDIVDELADHLQCAVNRELHSTRDAESAKQNALEHFGNPAQLARRLYLDAMKEKIMSQRISLLIAGVMTCVAAIAVVVMWLTFQRSEALIAQVQISNENLLQVIRQTLATPPVAAAPKVNDWQPVRIKAVSEGAERRPAEDFLVELEGELVGNSEKVMVSRKTDQGGIADFGLIHNGMISVRVRAPWRTSRSNSLLVKPGLNAVTEYVVPNAPQPGTVSLAVNWPPTIDRRKFRLMCELFHDNPIVDGQHWSAPDRVIRIRHQPVSTPLAMYQLINNQDQVAVTNFVYPYHIRDYPGQVIGGKGRPTDERFGVRVDASVFSEYGPTFTCDEGNYRLKALLVLPVESDEVIGAVFDEDEHIDTVLQSLNKTYAREPIPWIFRFVKIPALKFTAVAGQQNEWRFDIPPSVVEILQRHIAEAQSINAKNSAHRQPLEAPRQ